jgi:hypothetical protein
VRCFFPFGASQKELQDELEQDEQEQNERVILKQKLFKPS